MGSSSQCQTSTLSGKPPGTKAVEDPKKADEDIGAVIADTGYVSPDSDDSEARRVHRAKMNRLEAFCKQWHDEHNFKRKGAK